MNGTYGWYRIPTGHKEQPKRSWCRQADTQPYKHGKRRQPRPFSPHPSHLISYRLLSLSLPALARPPHRWHWANTGPKSDRGAVPIDGDYPSRSTSSVLTLISQPQKEKTRQHSKLAESCAERQSKSPQKSCSTRTSQDMEKRRVRSVPTRSLCYVGSVYVHASAATIHE